jgi:hypothetical protein
VTSQDLIRQARLRGELDEETSLVYRVWAALDPQRLPLEFSGQPQKLLKSLTPLFLEVRASWERLSPQARAMLTPYLLRPTEPGEEPAAWGHSYSVPAVFYDSPGGHFRIWYVTSTLDSPDSVYTHGDTIPDWIHLCAQVFDHVWKAEVDSMGYRPPPADGPWYPGEEDYGGNSRYDVYVENLDIHWVYGYTQSEFFASGGPSHAATSYMVIDNDYSSSTYPTHGESGLMVTAAHEFCHAVQFAYDTLEERFFMEITSTWMEDVVYDHINDYYNYLSHPGYSSIFSHPDLSLTTFDGFHEYSSCVWGHFLAKRFGQEIMRDIWEGCIQKTALDAMQDALMGRGEDLASAHHEFALWNYFTGSRAETALYYPEGDHYPQVRVYSDNLHTVYPVEVDSVSHPPEPLGASYVSFLPQETPGGLEVEFQGQPEVTWKVALLGIGPPHEVVQIPVDGFGHGDGHLVNWSQHEEAILMVTPFALSGSGVQYAYEGIPDSSLTEPIHVATILGQNYPNPVTPQTGYQTVIPFSIAQGAEVSFRIFTLDGRLVAKFDWSYMDPDDYYGPDKDRHYWDCTNASGEPVAAGVYLYQLRAGDFMETKKAVVVR